MAPLSYEPDHLTRMPLVDTGELFARCYLRFTAVDQPGVLADITGSLGKRGVGIESVFQEGQGEDGESVPVVPGRMRDQYKQMMAEHLEEISNLMIKNQIDYGLVRTDQPLDEVLFKYLTLREKLGRVR